MALGSLNKRCSTPLERLWPQLGFRHQGAVLEQLLLATLWVDLSPPANQAAQYILTLFFYQELARRLTALTHCLAGCEESGLQSEVDEFRQDHSTCTGVVVLRGCQLHPSRWQH